VKWTTKLRAKALKALVASGVDLNLEFGVDDGHPNASIVESAIHEIAHAVVLGSWYERRREDFGLKITNEISSLEETHPQAWIWQEILALAVEILVLRRLKLPYHRQIVYANLAKDLVYSESAFSKLVERATKTKTTKRRAERALKLLDQLCEEGHAQAAKAL